MSHNRNQSQEIIMSSVENFPARIVLTGGDNGRSHVVKEYDSHTRADTPTFSVADLWSSDRIPTSVDQEDQLDGALQLSPPENGVLVRLVSFPPDQEWKGTDAYAEALAAIGGSEEEGEDAGMHATDTIDVVTVTSGEIVAMLDDDEVVLRAGDSLIQRGTRHAWSNRTNAPAVIIATMISATR